MNGIPDLAWELACTGLLARSGFALRAETADDLPFLRALYRQLRWTEFAVLPLDDRQKEALIDGQFEMQRRQYAANYSYAAFLILAGAAGPMGRLYVGDDGEHLRVIDITLHDDVRGRGIGTALLAALQQAAAARGRGVSLHVAKDNRAQGLYVRLGFRAVHDNGVSLRMVWRAAPAEEAMPDD